MLALPGGTHDYLYNLKSFVKNRKPLRLFNHLKSIISNNRPDTTDDFGK